MHLIELYKSVQGESSFAGLPCIFVRLAGVQPALRVVRLRVHLRWRQAFSEDEIVAQIEALAPCKLAEFTGGEPMLQARELLPLMGRLLGHRLHADDRDLRPAPALRGAGGGSQVVDVKCPGAARLNSFRIENLAALTKNDEVKFVLSHRADYGVPREFILEHALKKKVGDILLPDV